MKRMVLLMPSKHLSLMPEQYSKVYSPLLTKKHVKNVHICKREKFVPLLARCTILFYFKAAWKSHYYEVSRLLVYLL